MACDTRLIISRITGEEVESKTWKDIYEHVKDEKEADKLYDQLLSPEFTGWFGDWINDPDNASKVVTEHGEPLMVYHGSPVEGITEFKAKFPAKNAEELGTKPGLFFTDNPAYAKEVKGDNEHLYPVFLHTINPDLEDREEIDHITAEQSSERGYDGLIGTDYGQIEGKTYVVFDKNQIKSLTNNGEYSKDSDNIYYSADNEKNTSSTASDVTVDKLHEWFRGNGVDFESVTGHITDNEGNILKANEKVDVVNRIIKVVEGHENTTIPEAGMHIVARIIRETNPKLFKEMMNKIGSYKIFEDVAETYKNFKAYQTPEGKPDIAKLKEEAIGKVLAEYYIKAEEGMTEKPELLEKVQQAQTWWGKIKEYLKDFFQGNPFTKAVEKFNKGKFNGIEGKSAQGDEFYQSKNSNNTLTVDDADWLFNNLRTITEKYNSNTLSDSRDFTLKEPLKFGETLVSAIEPNAGNSSYIWFERPTGKWLIKIDSRNDKPYLILSKINEHGTYYAQTLAESKIDELVQKAGLGNLVKSLYEDMNIKQPGSRRDQFDIQNQLGYKYGIKRSYKDIIRELKGDEFYSASGGGKDKGEEIFDRLKATPLNKVPGAEGNKRYEGEDDMGKKFNPEKTVTEFSQAVYDKAFGKRFENTRDKTKENTDKETGTRLHGYIEDVMNRSVDVTTGLRKPLDKSKGTILPGEEHIYDELETYVVNELDKYPEGTRFISEQVIYKGGKKPGVGDVASTLDFIAITKDGTVYNKDWKFMNNNNKEDISNTTQQAHKVQLGHYGEMLRTTYGVKNVRESHSVPFNLIYGEGDKKYILQNISKGSTNYSEINNKTLLPVTSGQVQLEDPKLTALVQNLHKLEQKLYDEKVPVDQRQEHSEKLQELSYAIRTLKLKNSMGEITTVALDMVRKHLKDLEDIKEFIDDPAKRKNISSEDKGKLVDKLLTAAMGLDVFRDMRTNLNEYTKDMKPAEKEALDRILVKINDNIKYATDLMYDKHTGTGILEKVGISIGDEYNIYNLLTKDKNLTKLQDWFNGSSSITFKTAQLWDKVRTKAQNKIKLKAKDAFDTLEKHNKSLTEWMGGTFDNEKLLNTLFQKTKSGEWKPYLISKTSDKFYSELTTRLEKPEQADREWIMKNIDTQKYNHDYQQALERRITSAETTVFDANSFQEDPDKRRGTLDQELREKSIENFKNTYDIFQYNSAFSFRNKWLKFYANKESWSDGYKNLNKPENKAALDFYNYIISINERARDIGGLGNFYRQFFPQIPLSSKQLIGKGKFAAAGDKFMTNLETISPGARDPMTGAVKNGIHVGHTSDLGIEGDYTHVSDDVMKSMNLYTKEVIAAEELSKVEGIAKALLAIEKTKDTLVYERGKLQTDATGRPIGGRNEVNIKWLEDQQNFDLYNKRNTGEEKGIDLTIGDKTYHVSYAKAIDTLVHGMTLKALGLNPSSALSNWFGGTSNTLILSGKNFTKQDIMNSYSNVLGAKFYSENGKKLISLMEHFVPFTEDVTHELGKKLGKKEMLNWLSGEGLMYFMRKSEKVIQMVNADVYFQNTMINNGALVNIREFVRDKYDYDNIFKKSDAERNQIKEIIEKEVNELKDTRNLYNDKSIKFDEETFGIDWTIPRASNSELKLVQDIQQLTRNVVGNRTPNEIAHLNLTLLGGALTQFRNWVPRMAQQRYGSFSYSSGEGSYEIGKMWMVGDVLKDHAQSKIKNLMDVLSFANLGGAETTIIGAAKRQYQRRLQEQSVIEGTDESMFAQTVSEADFVDNYIHSVKAQIREIQATLIMMSAFFAALAWAKKLNEEDEDYAHRGMAKYAVKMLDKFSDELGFFYSPNSFKSLSGMSGNVLPVFSVATDALKFIDHLGREGYYRYTGDDQKLEENKLLKYPISYIPAVNQLSSYLGIFSEDWGKTMGYKQQYQYNPLK